MQWTIAEARRRFSTLIHEAAVEPQLIKNRERPVAALISADLLDAFIQFQASRAERSMHDLIQAAAEICAEDDYVLEIPERKNRSNALSEDSSRGLGRHKRHR
ncbi:MAG: type II toxin-antitoxin system prevent-host-death family antitoxin [Deltaproteobacteria bacterium]|nr:type II toxin-antitoxin system prevent-host-death family antitoxin [Deltaproteobacteria bacterium]